MSKPPSSYAAAAHNPAGGARTEAPLPPSDGAWESAPAFLRDGHAFVSKRRQRLRADVFRTRLLFRDTICLGGADAARLFHDETRFQRDHENAATHRPRTALSAEVMTHESVARLAHLNGEEWRRSLFEWEARSDAFPLLHEVRLLLLRSACRWAGVPLAEGEQRGRAADIAAVIDADNSFGLRPWRGRLARPRLDRWLAGLVNATRSGHLQASPQSALALVAAQREPNGDLLAAEAAGAELLHLLRSVVATDRFLIFCAHALHEYPRCRARLASGDPIYADCFIREVRRYYPYSPPLAVARVKEDFVWRGHRFPEGARALLDCYGAAHDATAWPEPEVFRPERFKEGEGDLLNSHPDGDAEPTVVTLMKTGAHFLAARMDYEVPAQDLRISLRRMPAQPADGFIVRQVRRHIA